MTKDYEIKAVLRFSLAEEAPLCLCMGAKKKKQRHVRPKGSVTKNEEPSEDEGVELNPNPEPTEAAAGWILFVIDLALL